MRTPAGLLELHCRWCNRAGPRDIAPPSPSPLAAFQIS